MKNTKIVKRKLPKVKEGTEPYGRINIYPSRARRLEITGDTELPDFVYGKIWEDPIRGHRVACLDAANKSDIEKLMENKKAKLAIQDPPYNIKINGVFSNMPIQEYIRWSEKWVDNTINALADNASLYIWLGADIKKDFQPLPDFILMMRKKPVRSRNFLTLRNQRGYGTQKNWMAVRQELLYYTKGTPLFNIEAEYTIIRKKTKGYYKKIGGKLLENLERSKSNCIRAGNVWTDIQQIFYLLEENVEGCYAQKPRKATERIMLASSDENDLVIDFFSHAGTTLLQAEISKRVCYTLDISPAYCKISVARLLHYRNTAKTGWGRLKILQNGKIVAENSRLLGSPPLFQFTG